MTIFRDYVEEEKILKSVISAKDFFKKIDKQSDLDDYMSNTKNEAVITFTAVFRAVNRLAKAVNNFDEIIEKYGNWEVLNVSDENSSRYKAPTENMLNWKTIRLENSLKTKMAEVVLFNCGASESRSTQNMMAIFNNSYSNYDFLNFLFLPYTIIKGEFKLKKEKYHFYIYARLIGKEKQLIITKKEYCSHCFNDILLTDTSKKGVENLLSSKLSTTVKNNDLKIDYFCKALD